MYFQRLTIYKNSSLHPKWTALRWAVGKKASCLLSQALLTPQTTPVRGQGKSFVGWASSTLTGQLEGGDWL